MKIIIKLFLTFFKIGAFSFGGGYVMLPFIQKEIVENNKWIGNSEFIDIIGISQMTPGPIATNSSTFVGYKIAGILGAVAGTIAVILPAFLLALMVSKKFEKFKNYKFMNDMFQGLRPAVLGLIISAALTVGKDTVVDVQGAVICVISFFCIVKFEIHPIIVVLLSGFLGIIIF